MAAGLGYWWAVAAGFAGVCFRPALLVVGRGAARVLAAAGALAAGRGFRARVSSVVCGWGGAGNFGCEAFDDVVRVEVDQVVVVVEDGGLGSKIVVE